MKKISKWTGDSILKVLTNNRLNQPLETGRIKSPFGWFKFKPSKGKNVKFVYQPKGESQQELTGTVEEIAIFLNDWLGLKATQQFHEVPKFLPPRRDLRKLRVLDDPDFIEEDSEPDPDLIT